MLPGLSTGLSGPRKQSFPILETLRGQYTILRLQILTSGVFGMGGSRLVCDFWVVAGLQVICVIVIRFRSVVL